MNYVFPIVLIVLSNTVYNIFSKGTPDWINPYVSLVITYATALLVTILLWRITGGGGSFTLPFKQLNWASIGLGFAIIGLEVGYIFAYRAGWDISVCSLTANILLAVVLIFVGVLAYHEKMTFTQIAGVALCIAGLLLIGKK